VETRNDVSVATHAYIDGQHSTSIKAASASVTASDTSRITADAGAAVLSAAVGAVGAAVSVGVATAHNTITDDVSSFIANLDSGTGLQASSGGVTVNATENGTITVRASAAAAAVSGGIVALGAAGAGADAANVVLSNTNAYIQSSTVNAQGAQGNVAVGATNTNTIKADIVTASVSAALSAFASGAASIGISQARNFIGYDASGQEVGNGIQVRAYLTGSNVTAGGQLSETALSQQTIHAEVAALSAAASIAVAPGGLAVSLAGAGAITTNKVATDVEATIPDGGALG
jgi:hypothetical protein